LGEAPITVNITQNFESEFYIYIYDQNGKLITHRHFDSSVSSYVFDAPPRAGLYWVKVGNGKKFSTKPLVIQNSP
jgi:hypothetical protein